VHCRAGLGRTGTIIGCYMSEQYNILDAKALVAWMRLCRPGMVVGDQQQFLDFYISKLAKQMQKRQPQQSVLKDRVNLATHKTQQPHYSVSSSKADYQAYSCLSRSAGGPGSKKQVSKLNFYKP